MQPPPSGQTSHPSPPAPLDPALLTAHASALRPRPSTGRILFALVLLAVIAVGCVAYYTLDSRIRTLAIPEDRSLLPSEGMVSSADFKEAVSTITEELGAFRAQISEAQGRIREIESNGVDSQPVSDVEKEMNNLNMRLSAVETWIRQFVERYNETNQE